MYFVLTRVFFLKLIFFLVKKVKRIIKIKVYRNINMAEVYKKYEWMKKAEESFETRKICKEKAKKFVLNFILILVGVFSQKSFFRLIRLLLPIPTWLIFN